MQNSAKQAPESFAKSAGKFNGLTMLRIEHPNPQTKSERSAQKEAETEKESKQKMIKHEPPVSEDRRFGHSFV